MEEEKTQPCKYVNGVAIIRNACQLPQQIE